MTQGEIAGQLGISQMHVSRLLSHALAQLRDRLLSDPGAPAPAAAGAYTDRVNELIEAKKSKQEFQPATGPLAATNVSDLTAALRASVEAAKKKPGGKAAGKRGKTASAPRGSRKTQARKTSGKKSPAKNGTARQQPRKPAA
jgi:hypothetical protein